MKLGSELAADTTVVLSKPCEVGGLTVVPVLRTLVGASPYGLLASLSPVALIIVQGEAWEVITLPGAENITATQFKAEDIKA